MIEAIQYFEQAIVADPRYALAYTGLSDAYALQLDYRSVPVQEGFARAKHYARKALELDDSLAEAHASLAWVLFVYDWDWEQARVEFCRSIELDPRYATAHQWYAFLLASRGRADEALVEGHTAQELDPSSVSVRRTLGWLYFYARRYEQARYHLSRAVAMNPGAEETFRVLGLALAIHGELDEAERVLRDAVVMHGAGSYTTATLGYALGSATWSPHSTGRRRRTRSAAAGSRTSTSIRCSIPCAITHASRHSARACAASGAPPECPRRAPDQRSDGGRWASAERRSAICSATAACEERNSRRSMSTRRNAARCDTSLKTTRAPTVCGHDSSGIEASGALHGSSLAPRGPANWHFPISSAGETSGSLTRRGPHAAPVGPTPRIGHIVRPSSSRASSTKSSVPTDDTRIACSAASAAGRSTQPSRRRAACRSFSRSATF